MSRAKGDHVTHADDIDVQINTHRSREVDKARAVLGPQLAVLWNVVQCLLAQRIVILTGTMCTSARTAAAK